MLFVFVDYFLMRMFVKDYVNIESYGCKFYEWIRFIIYVVLFIRDLFRVRDIMVGFLFLLY